ncbi:DNA translocase FtsK [Brevundimonas mediterranea]|jgi:DNA segregation ATPase FtsK/SpoIIIE-like protein|uniref:DNA translocase FtsK n=1 Tax=Brevundimonas mediterranea TaxID=74329 RepID=A0A7Z8Y5M2_9CAUL|nr:DNA translocase FtsK [Brevundimonas mediterranea]VDC51412.1 DNA translocase FtsK [Brevundimonas mediterranea]
MPTSSPDDYATAVQIVTTERDASVSFLQRRMGISYSEAASLITRMERSGVVSPRPANRPREILTPPAPRTPEDGRTIQTPEDGRPVHTR